jgi:hypothetical protein
LEPDRGGASPEPNAVDRLACTVQDILPLRVLEHGANAPIHETKFTTKAETGQILIVLKRPKDK